MFLEATFKSIRLPTMPLGPSSVRAITFRHTDCRQKHPTDVLNSLGLRPGITVALNFWCHHHRENISKGES